MLKLAEIFIRRVIMANLSAIEKKLQAQYKANQDASNANYQSQLDALTGKNTLDMAQANTAKNAIPTAYDPQRAGAALTMAQANSALPENVLNRGSSYGANGNSGLAYSMGRDIGNSYQKNMGLIGTAQNKDLNTAQQNIDNMGLTYNNNYNQLQTEKTGAANNIQAQGDVAMQNQINAEQAAIEAQAAATAKAALDQQNFEQSQTTEKYKADLQHNENIYKINNPAPPKATAPPKPPALQSIVTGVMNRAGSTDADGNVNLMTAYNSLNDDLDYYKITDPAVRKQALILAGLQNAPQQSATKAWNDISQAGGQYTAGGKYTTQGKSVMLEMANNRYNEGTIDATTYSDIVKHYGL
jgi:hypothetical protein